MSVFISYRRADSAHVAGRLHARIAESLPGARIFMDVDSISPGTDFASAIDEAVSRSHVVLVLIGVHWDQERRLARPGDFVALEVQAALGGSGRLIPVLVDGARMPTREELPRPLQPLAGRQALRLDHATFTRDSAHLIEVIREARPTSARVRRPWLVGTAVVSFAAVVVLVIVLMTVPTTAPVTASPGPMCSPVSGDVAALPGDGRFRRGNDDPELPTFTPAAGALRITAPPGSDVRTEQGRITAPSLLVPVEGDFVLETQIDLVPLVAYQAAGLMVVGNTENYVRLERGIGDFDAIALEFSREGRHVKVHGPFLGEPQPVRTETTTVGLRLVRTGETLRAAWRDVAANGSWRALAGDVPLAGPANVGVAVLNTGAARDAENFTVTVRELSLLCGAPPT